MSEHISAPVLSEQETRQQGPDPELAMREVTTQQALTAFESQFGRRHPRHTPAMIEPPRHDVGPEGFVEHRGWGEVKGAPASSADAERKGRWAAYNMQAVRWAGKLGVERLAQHDRLRAVRDEAAHDNRRPRR